MSEPGAHEVETTSTGVPELDRAIGRLFWGDNVVWEQEEGASAEPFYQAIAMLAPDYDFAGYVTLTRPPSVLRAVYPQLEVIDGRPDGAFGKPAPLLGAIRSACENGRKGLLLFDSLDAMSEQWGAETAGRFFTRSCPILLDLGAIAYWSLTASGRSRRLRRDVEEVTQCVIAVGEARLRIAKAEGRPSSVQGSVFRYRIEDGRPELDPAPAAARLGSALRAVRVQRHLSQRELARMAGVSASAISQAERGQRGLSLETLIELTEKLGITLDELLRGEIEPGYRLARLPDPHTHAEGRPLPLFGDPLAGLRSYLLRLPPHGEASPAFMHKGVELIAVGSGLVQIVLGTGRPVLRHGEALLVDRATVRSLRNLGDHEAMVFWIFRDETSRSEASPT